MKDIKDMTINELWDMKDELCKLYDNKCDKCPVKDECMFNYEGGTINFMEEVRKSIDKYHSDKEAKDEELAMQGYFTLDTIKERLKEGSLSVYDVLPIDSKWLNSNGDLYQLLSDGSGFWYIDDIRDDLRYSYSNLLDCHTKEKIAKEYLEDNDCSCIGEKLTYDQLRSAVIFYSGRYDMEEFLTDKQKKNIGLNYLKELYAKEKCYD